MEAVAGWAASAEPAQEISFAPGRVLLQDFTGVPAVVDLAAMRDAMHDLGGDPQRINPQLPVETVNLRVRARASYPLPEFPTFPLEGPEGSEKALIQEKKVVLDGGPVLTRFYLRTKLKAGNEVQGPAVIVEYSATTLIPNGYRASVDQYLNLLIEPNRESTAAG